MSPLLILLVAQAKGKPIHPAHQTVSVNEAPVTAREVREAFSRTIALLIKVNGHSLGQPSIPDLKRPATRSEVVEEMARLCTASESTLRFTPMPTRHDGSTYRIDAAERSSLDKLVALGFVGRVSPLAVGPESGLTPKQFGDALGFFLARMGQVTHLPSPKWTPALKND